MRRARGGGAVEERAEWAGQVFVLRDVFVNHFGQVFNKTHLFDTGGCNWKAKFMYPKDAPVVSHQTVVNLMVARSDQRSYHQVIERLPLLHVLRKMTKNPALKDAHVALPSSRGLRRMLTSILDFDLPWTPFPFHTPNTLLFAESLVQPLSEHCDEPQHSVWRDIRTSLFEPDHPYHPRASSIASPRTSLSLPSVIQSHHLFLQASSQAIHDAKAAQNPGSKEKLSVSYPTPFFAGVLPMLDVDLGEDEVAWAALPSDWMVVVGLQGLHNRADAEAIRNVVLQHFPAHRVASYCPSMSVEELSLLSHSNPTSDLIFHFSSPARPSPPSCIAVRNLFSRTALFITVTDSTLMHTIFMRPATLVLELRHPSALRFPSYSLSSVLRLQHYISVCSTSPSFGGEEPDVDPAMAAVSGGGAEGENSPLFCDLDHVKEVVDRAAQFVYLSEAAYAESIKRLGKRKGRGGEERAAAKTNLAVPMLPAATSEGVDWGLSVPDLTKVIPGSVLRTSGQVESFRSWAACIGQAGRWKFDGRPRFLPWPYKGAGTCDIRAMETTKGVIAVNEADDVVRRGGAPSEWKIRGELKYVWDVLKSKCDYKEDVASVGMGEERYEEEEGGGGGGGELGEEGEEESDLLEEDNGDEGEEEGEGEGAPVLPAADAIILNRGPHYREDNDFEPHLRTTLLYLRNRFPDKLLIYRNSAGGHVDCPKYHKPIEKGAARPL
ncbi:unnamed protein product [Closterium sp. Yama58-4]|nr:unnamed protein product [Closterium sp. Yama58-4]